MKKTYVDPQISFVILNTDVIASSKLLELEWEDGEDLDIKI